MSRHLIIIQAAQVDAANEVAAQFFDTVGGEQTFTVPLFAVSAQDDNAPTHYWCSAEVEEAKEPTLAQLQPQFPGCSILPYDANSDPSFPQRTLTELGLRTARPKM